MLAQPNAMSMFQNEMRRRLGFGPSSPQASSTPAAGPIGMMGHPMNPMGGMNTGIVPPNQRSGGMAPANSTMKPGGPLPGGPVDSGQLPFNPMGLPQHFTPAPIFGGFNAMQHPGMNAPTSFPMFQSQAPEQSRKINLLQPWMG